MFHLDVAFVTLVQLIPSVPHAAIAFAADAPNEHSQIIVVTCAGKTLQSITKSFCNVWDTSQTDHKLKKFSCF